MSFTEKLRRLMDDRKATKVSLRAGLHRTAISDYINRGHMPGADVALRIARALNVSFEWLVDPSADWPPVPAEHFAQQPARVA